MQKNFSFLLGLTALVLLLSPLGTFAAEEAAPAEAQTAQAAQAAPTAAEAGSQEAAQNVEAAASEANSCPVSLFQEPAETAPVFMGPPHKPGYCRCGCGVGCTSSADCGGAACSPFITCC